MTGKNGDERLLEMQLRRVVIRVNSDHQYIYLVEKEHIRKRTTNINPDNNSFAHCTHHLNGVLLRILHAPAVT